MEIFDVGSVPVERVLDRLLTGDVLAELIGGRHNQGAGCFVLVHSMIAPQFYEGLIEHVDSIDATTRDRVAFIVFHGDRSGLVRESSHRGRRALGRRRIVGLSVSSGGDIVDKHPHGEGEERASPLRAWHGEPAVAIDIEPNIDDAPPKFSDHLSEQFRFAPEEVSSAAFRQHMSRAAAALAAQFGVSESDFPCLLFVNPRALDQHFVVPLDIQDPLSSLYQRVLRPLSNAFRTLTGYREQRDIAERAAWMRKRAEEVIAETGSRDILQAELQEAQASLAHKGKAQAARIAALGALHDALCARCDDATVRERLVAATPWADELRAKSEAVMAMRRELDGLEDVLRAIERGDTPYRSQGHRALLQAKAEKRIRRLTPSVADRWRRLAAAADGLRSRAGLEIQPLQQALWRLEYRLRDLDAAEENLRNYSASSLRSLAIAADEARARLMHAGWPASTLDEHDPEAFSVLAYLRDHAAFGVRTRDSSRAAGIRDAHTNMRILFLAANPLHTSRLDLEEELHALEAELRAVRYRDRITLIARHAVRPDDLLRHVRDDRPTVLHFSGHGEGRRGIVLRTDEGGYHFVEGAALRRFLEGRGVELLVLNACATRAHGDAVGAVVPTVIGTTDELDDRAARRFSVAFYRALGNGLSIADAFRDGGDACALHGLPDVYWSHGMLDRTLLPAPA